MINAIVGSKGKMNQGFIEGRRIPVTRITAGPCIVTLVRKMDKDGYWAVQLGFGSKSTKSISKALLGHLGSSVKDKKAPKIITEIRLKEEPTYVVGDVINASDVFKKGDIVSISGVSKGKGFAGVVKRHHFAGGPKTHGQSDRHRAPGSIGQGTTPGRVLKGKRMAGRMGNEKVTIKNLQIVSIDQEKNEIQVSGPIPGITEGILIVRKIAEGKLEGIQEVQAQVIEGEAPAAEEGAAAPEGKAEESKVEVKEEPAV